MKRIKDRPMTDTLKAQLITQEIRINECGSEAYKAYINHSIEGTIFSNRFNIKPQQRI